MIVFCGDTHFRGEYPFFEAGKSFMDWFANQWWNTEENTLIHLGDVTHGSLITGKVYREVVDWFLNKLNFSRIIVLAGNHDYHRHSKSSSIDPLKALNDVEVYDTPQSIEVEGKHMLMLPYYYSSLVDGLPPMKDYYQSLPQEWTGIEWDYILGHYNDETEKVFGTYIDTSYLKGKRILGHIHFPRGNYIGTPVITRKDESGNNNQILVDDGKKLESYPTPRFLDYYEVTYSESLTEVEAEYPIWDVIDAPSEDAAYEMYDSATIRKVHLKNERKKDESTEDDNGEVGATQEKSVKEHMEDFFSKHSYSDKTKEKVLEVL